MNSIRGHLYFCTECKKVLESLDDLLFIDEHSHKGFCSEECIEDFHLPLIKHFEIEEHTLRKKMGLLHEVALSERIDQDLVEGVLTDPSEVYKQSNELEENFFYFIKHYNDFSAVVIASVYRKEASFVYLSLITKSQDLVKEFRYGEMVTDWFREKALEEEAAESTEEPILDDEENFEFMNLLESKKSKILADVIINRKDSDIAFEDYPGYESCFQETLDQPDEVFEKKDNEGDVLFTYIKTFNKSAFESFYYIVICLKKNSDEANVNVYPILAVPTNDMEMCQEFRGGTRLTGPLKN